MGILHTNYQNLLEDTTINQFLLRHLLTHWPNDCITSGAGWLQTIFEPEPKLAKPAAPHRGDQPRLRSCGVGLPLHLADLTELETIARTNHFTNISIFTHDLAPASDFDSPVAAIVFSLEIVDGKMDLSCCDSLACPACLFRFLSIPSYQPERR